MPILKLIEKGLWTGTAEQLLTRLEVMVEDSVRRNPNWPKTPRSLAGALRRLNPNLRPLGVQVTFERDNRRERTQVITNALRVPSAPSVSSEHAGATPRRD